MRTLIAGVIGAACLNGQASAETDYRELGWLPGCWTGRGLGGEVSECWMPTPDGRLVGVFQYVQDHELVFSEILMMGEAGGIDGYHVKHFNSDMTGWEAQDEFVSFPLVEINADEAVFEGLVYRHQEPDHFIVELDIADASGEVATTRFSLYRVYEH